MSNYIGIQKYNQYAKVQGQKLKKSKSKLNDLKSINKSDKLEIKLASSEAIEQDLAEIYHSDTDKPAIKIDISKIKKVKKITQAAFQVQSLKTNKHPLSSRKEKESVQNDQNYFSADVYSSQQSIPQNDAKPQVKMRFIKNKRKSQQVPGIQKKGFVSPQIKQKASQKKAFHGQFIMKQLKPNTHSETRKFNQRSGSLSRRNGDDDDHLEENLKNEIQIKNLIAVPKNHRNSKQENIYESKAYLSNQPNLTNKIGNGAIKEQRVFEMENLQVPPNENILDDPFLDYQPNDEFLDIQESHDFSQYRTVNETYKSVGSLQKQNQNQQLVDRFEGDQYQPTQEDVISTPNSMSSGSRINTENSQYFPKDNFYADIQRLVAKKSPQVSPRYKLMQDKQMFGFQKQKENFKREQSQNRQPKPIQQPQIRAIQLHSNSPDKIRSPPNLVKKQTLKEVLTQKKNVPNMNLTINKVKSDKLAQVDIKIKKLKFDDLIFSENMFENLPKTHREIKSRRPVKEGELSHSTSEENFADEFESNCTEERNFTPGQKQFKNFLRLTADRKNMDLKKIKNVPIQNRMSPTPQIIPIDIFSGDTKIKKSETSDDANYEETDSANLSNYNIFPDDEQNSQNLSGIIQKFNERNMHIEYNNQNERRSQVFQPEYSDCLSPFDPKTHKIQDFSINMKNFQQIECVENEENEQQTIPQNISLFAENKGVSSLKQITEQSENQNNLNDYILNQKLRINQLLNSNNKLIKNMGAEQSTEIQEEIKEQKKYPPIKLDLVNKSSGPVVTKNSSQNRLLKNNEILKNINSSFPQKLIQDNLSQKTQKTKKKPNLDKSIAAYTRAKNKEIFAVLNSKTIKQQIKTDDADLDDAEEDIDEMVYKPHVFNNRPPRDAIGDENNQYDNFYYDLNSSQEKIDEEQVDDKNKELFLTKRYSQYRQIQNSRDEKYFKVQKNTVRMSIGGSMQSFNRAGTQIKVAKNTQPGRKTRIKSLYATTNTQDLTLDLHKINNELRDTPPIIDENVAAYSNMKIINQSQNHQFIGGTRQKTIMKSSSSQAVNKEKSTTRIQDIKQSSSKLTMAAQLQKYKFDMSNSFLGNISNNEVQVVPQCYSPKFNHRQVVQSAQKEHKSSYNKMRIPKTTKHGESLQKPTMAPLSVKSARGIHGEKKKDQPQFFNFAEVPHNTAKKHERLSFMEHISEKFEEFNQTILTKKEENQKLQHRQVVVQEPLQVQSSTQIFTEEDSQPKLNLEIQDTELTSGANQIQISSAVKRHNQLKNQERETNEQEQLILEQLPFNGCSCDDQKQKTGCINTQNWLKIAWKDDNYQHYSNYKMYQLYINITDNNEQIEQDISMDLERTFQHLEYFQMQSTKESLKRILIAFSNYETTVGYVQGMNFIAAVLLYHAGEVAAFWLLCALMDTYKLKMVLSQGLPGLPGHEERLEKVGREVLPELFEHFDKTYVTLNLFSTDWIISIFMNFIPIELTHVYLGLFFQHSWKTFDNIAIAILKFYEKDLMKMNDAGDIVGQIKQARLGCEHLLILGTQPSLLSARKSLNGATLRESVNDADSDAIPFSPIKLIQENPYQLKVKASKENFDDSRSEIMNEKINSRSHSMVPIRQSNQSYKMNMKNMQMWQKIIGDVFNELQQK